MEMPGGASTRGYPSPGLSKPGALEAANAYPQAASGDDYFGRAHSGDYGFTCVRRGGDSDHVGHGFAVGEVHPGDPPATPPAKLAPRGLKGLFDDSGGSAEDLDTSLLPTNSVLINVYDLGEEEVLQNINRSFTLNDKVLVGGIFHAAVEVYGKEWSYGFCERGSGVFANAPRLNDLHTYRATVVMDNTKLTEEQVMEIIDRYRATWQGMEYDILHQNCLHFARAFCSELGAGKMPGWIDRIARAGASLDNFKNAASEKVDLTKDLVQKLSDDTAAHAQALSVGISRWSRDAFSAFSRALGDDKGQTRPKQDSLRASLRNRGGVRVQKTDGREDKRGGEAAGSEFFEGKGQTALISSVMSIKKRIDERDEDDPFLLKVADARSPAAGARQQTSTSSVRSPPSFEQRSSDKLATSHTCSNGGGITAATEDSSTPEHHERAAHTSEQADSEWTFVDGAQSNVE